MKNGGKERVLRRQTHRREARKDEEDREGGEPRHWRQRTGGVNWGSQVAAPRRERVLKNSFE